MYIAVDIETTGLDPEKHQILEVAMVADTGAERVVDCPFLHLYVYQNPIIGTPYALVMNAHAIKIIAMNVDSNICEPGVVSIWVRKFVNEYACGGEVNVVGKNAAGFDLPFLKRLPEWPTRLFSHRVLDVGSLWAGPKGILSQAQLFMAYKHIVEHIPGEPHEALFDARVSLALARLRWKEDQ